MCMYDLKHSDVCTCDMTHSDVCMCDMTHSYVCMCDMMHPYMCMCDMKLQNEHKQIGLAPGLEKGLSNRQIRFDSIQIFLSDLIQFKSSYQI